MMLTLFKNRRHITHYFDPQELDSIKEVLYNNNIKWYSISSTEQENEEYERLSKRHN